MSSGEEEQATSPPSLDKRSQSSEDLVTLVEKYDVHVFRPSTYRFDPRTLNLPEDFFNTTLSDVQDSNTALSERARNDAPLMTKKMRQAEENARMARFRKVLIRVLLPDRHSLQGVFTPKSTVQDVTDFVKRCLRDPDTTKFHLFVVPPKMVLSNMRNTLWSEKMVPAAQVYLGVDAGPTETRLLLNESVFTLAEDAPPPHSFAPAASSAPTDDKAAAAAAAAKRAKNAASKGKGKGIPKWLKRK